MALLILRDDMNKKKKKLKKYLKQNEDKINDYLKQLNILPAGLCEQAQPTR